jgi:predicted flap endonuclease-1-like 5' DNA nuclease
MQSITKIEGIQTAYKKKLAEVGIRSTEALLKKGATPKGRKEIEEKTGISHKHILDWVNRADLFRIKGVAEQYSDLLEEAGVDTVVELSNRKADNLLVKIIEVNNTKKLVRRPPALSMVKDWIEQAKKMNRIVEY